jgi:hypothetical protein
LIQRRDTGCTDQESGFESSRRRDFSLFSTAFGPTLGPVGSLLGGKVGQAVKLTTCIHVIPLKNACSYTSISSCLHGVLQATHTDKSEFREKYSCLNHFQSRSVLTEPFPRHYCLHHGDLKTHSSIATKCPILHKIY